MKMHARAESQPLGVLSRNGERRAGDVNGIRRDVFRSVLEHRERDCTRPRADVSEAQGLSPILCQPSQSLDGRFHKDLRIGTRNQRRTRHGEIKPHELAPARDVGRWHAPRTLSDRLAERRKLFLFQRLVKMDVEVDALLFEHMREKHLGIEARRLDALFREVALCPREDRADRPDFVRHHSACLSFSA